MTNETRDPAAWLEALQARRRELEPLYRRMDADRGLLGGQAFRLADPYGRAIRDAYHVTLTEPALFAAKCQARLGSVARQTVVEGEGLSAEAAERVAAFLDDAGAEIDARLARRGEPGEFAQYCELVCVRGPIAVQVVTRAEAGRYVPDVRPIDSRCLAYDTDSEGVRWAAVFSTRRSEDVRDEYGLAPAGASAEVTDLWTEARELVWVDGRLVKDEAHGYGECPFALAWPAAGSVLKDGDGLRHRGESIFYLLRGEDGRSLYQEKNYVASILKTQSAETLAPPLQFPAPPEGEYQEMPERYPGPGQMVQVRQPAQLVPKPDVRASTRLYLAEIDRLIQQATFNTIDFGSATFPLSAVAMSRLSEGRNELLLPRLQAIAQLYQRRSRLLISQFTALGQELRLGEEGRRRSYRPAQLAGEYALKFRFYGTSHEELAGDLSLANAAAPWYSEEFVLREILKVQDPAAMAAARRAERAERADPALALYRQMHAFIDEGSGRADMQARLILHRILAMIRRGDWASGETPRGVGRPAASTLPLFGAAGNDAKQEAQDETG